MDVSVGLWRKLSTEELMLLNCGIGEDSWESVGLQGDPSSPSYRRSVLSVHWKDWCWGWNSNTLATWCEELTHMKRPWCWERLRAGGEGDDRGRDGWMATLTRWTWVWVDSRSWWWTGRPGVLQFMGSHRVGHGWATELTIGTSKSARLKPNSPSFPSKPAPPVFLISVALPYSQSWKPEYRSFFPFQKQAATKAIQLERMIFSTSGARTTGHPHGRKMNLDTDF